MGLMDDIFASGDRGRQFAAGLMARLPSFSSVANGVMNGASEDAQTVGDIGSAVGDMGSRTADLLARLRSGEVDPTQFAKAVGSHFVDKAVDAGRSAVTAPRDAISGDLQVFDPATGHVSDEAMRRANEMAGLAMTGSAPFKAPAGAVRSFGGAAAKDDPIAALEAMLADIKPEAPPPGPRMLDPTAKSWDLYHGSTPGPDFPRFDPTKGNNPTEQAVFFAPSADTASGYAGRPKAGAEAGSRVYRTTVDPGKTAVFDLAHLAETSPEFNARARQVMMQTEGSTYGPVFDDYMSDFTRNRSQMRDLSAQGEAMSYPPSRLDGISFAHGHIGAAVQMAKEQGLDTAILRGIVEHGGDDQVIALTPNRVRSYYAPDQLLYSGGPGGLAAAVLAAPDSKRQ